MSWCAALGTFVESESGAPAKLLGERWSGNQWELELPVMPTTGEASGLESISCTGPFECTAVGKIVKRLPSGPYETLGERLELP
jgi:hypothetical protein